jgi:hypothetical protein
MSIKLYSFIEQKTDNWQDEYRFKCAESINTYLKGRRRIEVEDWAIQDITKQKRRRAAT